MVDLTDEMMARIVSSQSKFAVLKLFKENPYVMDNRLGLSLWVGRPEKALESDLEDMVGMGILTRWGTEPGAIYALTRDQETRRQLDERWRELSRRASEIRWQQEQHRATGHASPGPLSEEVE